MRADSRMLLGADAALGASSVTWGAIFFGDGSPDAIALGLALSIPGAALAVSAMLEYVRRHLWGNRALWRSSSTRATAAGLVVAAWCATFAVYDPTGLAVWFAPLSIAFGAWSYWANLMVRYATSSRYATSTLEFRRRGDDR